MKKTISVMLAAVMTAALFTGCGGGSGSGTSQPAQGAQASQGGQEASKEAQTSGGGSAEGGDITFTFSKVSYPSVTLPDGQTSGDNVVLDYIRDKYHVNMVLDWQAEASEYNNKLSLNIASGSLPDIFYCDNYRTFLQLAQNGLLADLTDIYDANISDTIKAIDKSYNGRNLSL